MEVLVIIEIDASSCNGCGYCVGACPTGAIPLKDGIAVIDEDECHTCFVCINVCDNEAIRF